MGNFCCCCPLGNGGGNIPKQNNKNETNTKETNINNNENNLKVNQNSNNIDDNNKFDNNNPKIPPLYKYNPNSSLSESKSSYNSTSSDGQQEILKEGGKLNYKNKLSESSINPISDSSRLTIDKDHYLNIKAGTQIKPILPKFQRMIHQNDKRKDNSINNNEKVIKDNGPILDIENIS